MDLIIAVAAGAVVGAVVSYFVLRNNPAVEAKIDAEVEKRLKDVQKYIDR